MQLSSEQKRFLAWLLIAAFSGCVLWLLKPVLTPFVVALVLAYALTPVVTWLDRLGRGRMPRVLAVVLVELLAIVRKRLPPRVSGITGDEPPTSTLANRSGSDAAGTPRD